MPIITDTNSAVSTKKDVQTHSSKKKKIFRVGTISPLTKSNLSDHFFEAVRAMCELGFQVSVLAEGDEEAQKMCFDLLKLYPENFDVMESTSKNREKILKKLDLVVFAAPPSKKQLNEVLAENIVPIIPEHCGITNFEAQDESGEGFTFEQNNFWQFMSAIIRASENFKFNYDWRNIKRNLAEV